MMPCGPSMQAAYNMQGEGEQRLKLCTVSVKKAGNLFKEFQDSTASLDQLNSLPLPFRGICTGVLYQSSEPGEYVISSVNKRELVLSQACSAWLPNMPKPTKACPA